MSVEGAVAARMAFLWRIACPRSKAARIGELDDGILQIGVSATARMWELSHRTFELNKVL